MYTEIRFQQFRSHPQRQRQLRIGRTATEWWKLGIKNFLDQELISYSYTHLVIVHVVVRAMTSFENPN